MSSPTKLSYLQALMSIGPKLNKKPKTFETGTTRTVQGQKSEVNEVNELHPQMEASVDRLSEDPEECLDISHPYAVNNPHSTVSIDTLQAQLRVANDVYSHPILSENRYQRESKTRDQNNNTQKFKFSKFKFSNFKCSNFKFSNFKSGVGRWGLPRVRKQE